MKKQLTLEESRIKNALRMHKSELLPRILSAHDLKSLAKFTNAARILHYSGNCVLLATCLYYNLLKGKKTLSVVNMSNPLTGLDSDLVEEMVFGCRMTTLATVNSLSQVTAVILTEYAKTRRLYYKIVAHDGYRVPMMGETGHEFNAAVITNNGLNPTVLFVDAWKTSEHVATEKMMSRRFGTGANFDLKIIPSTVA